MTQLFNIILTGKFVPEVDTEAALAKFASASGISVEKAQSLFDAAPSVIKRNTDQATATSYQEKLTAIGIVTRVESTETVDAEPVTAEASSDSQPTIGKHTVGFTFAGDGFEYFKIWIVNILLIIVTLGLYSPWAKVRNTQYFYGNTQLDSASFSFTADPVKMLIGRLIALGMFIAITAVQTFAPLFGVLLFLSLIFIFPWILNKSLAFYARNTTYRNIRFRFTGTYWPAFKAFFLWPLAALFTLMILMPMAIQKQQAYVANNHSYGNKSFSFRAGISDYYIIFLIAFALTMAGGMAGFLLALIFPPLAMIGMALGYIAAIIYFMVAMNNLFLNHLSLADHDFNSNFEYKSYGLILVLNFVLTILTLGLYIPWAKVKLAHYAAQHTHLEVNGDLNKFVAVTQEDVSAFGEEFGDVFDMEVGF